LSNNFFKHGLTYTLAQAFILVVGLISFPILTKNLTPEDYGLIGLYTIIASLIASAGKLGIQHSILRLRGDYDEPTFISNIVFLLLGPIFLNLFFITCAIITNYFSSYKLADIDIILVLISIAFLEQIRGFFINFILSKQQSKLVAQIKMMSKLVTVLLTLTAILFVHSSSRSFIYAVLIANILISFITIIITSKLNIFKGISIDKVNPNISKAILLFGLPLFGLEVIAMFHAYIDRFLIKYFMGNAYLGYYSAHYNMANMISELVIGGVMLAIVPAYMSIWNKDGKEKTELFLNNLTSVFLLLFPILISSLYVISEELFIVLATAEYANYSYLLPIIAAGVIINATSPIYSAGLKLKKKGAVMFYAVIISTIINITLNVLFIPVYGLIAAAWSTTISFTFVCIFITLAGSKTIKLTFNLFYLIRGITYSIIFIYICQFINIEHDVQQLLGTILFGLCFFLITLYLFEKKFILTIINAARDKNVSS